MKLAPKLVGCTLLALTLFSFNKTFAQDILWEKSYGGKHADFLTDAVPTPDYGFILGGSSLSKKTGNKTEDNRGDLDYWVWKMDEKGDLDWQKSFGGKGQDKLNRVLLTNDGGYLLAGSSDSGKELDKKDTIRGRADFWIIKLNAKGNEEWQKTIGGNGQDEITCVITTMDGGFVIGGASSSNTSGEKTDDSFGGIDYWILKLDREGKIVWQKTFGGQYSDELRSISMTNDKGFLLGGSSNSPEGGNKTGKCLGERDYWIIKLDDKGMMQWQQSIGSAGDDKLSVVCTTKDGDYIIAGSSNSETGNDKTKSNERGTDFWVVKMNPERKIIWQETYNIGETDVLTSLVENDNKTILLGGYAQGEIARKKNSKKAEESRVMAGTDDYVALKINENGEELWRRSIGSSGQDILQKVIETRDGGYLMAGTSKGKISNDRNSGIGSNDFWVVKLKDKHKPDKDKKPVEAIPNPATDYTNIIIGYDFTKGTATVADMAGHILQQFEITGRTVPVDLQGLPDGIYIVNIKTDKQSDGVKVIKQSNQ